MHRIRPFSYCDELMRKYYEAYDDRYRQVHEKDLQWSSDMPSPIVSQILERYAISADSTILELGCGEGRDAVHLLKQGRHVTATDISPEAIRHCREKYPDFAEYFQILDCLSGRLEQKFDFIYAIALIHMLVEDTDRTGFYHFIREHLNNNGIALVCTMGDGTIDRRSDIATAFDLQERTHGESGEKLLLAGTSCRMVAWENFLREIIGGGMQVAEHGLTAVEPDFPVMMYAVMKKC